MKRLLHVCECLGWVFWLSIVPLDVTLNAVFFVAVFTFLFVVPTGWESYREQMPRVRVYQ